MELTFQEVVNFQIAELIQANDNDLDVQSWYEYYKDDCDFIMNRFYNQKRISISTFNERQKDAWYWAPPQFKKDVVAMIGCLYDEGAMSSGPRPTHLMVQQIKHQIPLRQTIVSLLRKGRDSGILEYVWKMSKSDAKKEQWMELDDTLKNQIKETFVELCRHTIAFNNSVYYVKNSSMFWNALTQQWLNEAGLLR